MRLTLVFDASPPFCACESKPALDRDWVEGRVVRRTRVRDWGPDGERC